MLWCDEGGGPRNRAHEKTEERMLRRFSAAVVKEKKDGTIFLANELFMTAPMLVSTQLKSLLHDGPLVKTGQSPHTNL